MNCTRKLGLHRNDRSDFVLAFAVKIQSMESLLWYQRINCGPESVM